MMIVCVFVATRRSLLCIRAETICKLPRKLAARSAFTLSCCLCSLHSFLLPMFLLIFCGGRHRSPGLHLFEFLISFSVENGRERRPMIPYSFSSLYIFYLSISLLLSLSLSFSSVSLPSFLSPISLSFYLSPFLFSLFLICFSFCSLCSVLSPLIEVSVTRESKAEVQLIVVIVLKNIGCGLCI